MDNSWPPGNHVDRCTCTPLADDPKCAVHMFAPPGLKVYTWKDVAATRLGKALSYLFYAILFLVGLGILRRAVQFALGES